MSTDEYILFIDSGLGGMSVMDALIKKGSEYPIAFYADAKHFPYGEKNVHEIAVFLEGIYKFAISQFSVKMIVIACNTASISAIDKLRSIVDVPVVGTVPAIKTAAELTKNGNIGVIATKTSVKQNYLSELAEKFASDLNVYICGTEHLATAVEKEVAGEELQNLFKEDLAFFADKDIDTLVLGCTHYTFLKDDLNDFFNGEVQIIDSCDGVSRRILSLLTSGNFSEHSPNRLYLNDKQRLEQYKRWNQRYKWFDEIFVEDETWKKV